MNAVTTLLVSALLAAGEPDEAADKSAGKETKAKPTQSAKSPGGKASAKKSGSSLDEELFGELTGDTFEGLAQPKLNPGAAAKQKADDKGAAKPVDKKSSDNSAGPGSEPPPDFAAGEDLGQESNPLLDLGHRMRRAESLISEGTTGQPTQRLQDSIVSDLEKLIKLASQT